MGNRIGRAVTDSAGTTHSSYEYDSADQASAAAPLIRYGYDADGLRVRKHVADSASGATRTVHYLLDTSAAHAQVAARATTVQEMGGASRTARSVFQWGAGPGAAGIGLIRQEHWADGDAGSGTPTALLLPLQGHLGTSLGAVDANGRVVETIGHDAFGQRTDGTVAAQSHRFAGEYWDEDAQLVYLRARWYDPKVGRFISGDPFEGRQGDPRSLNRYGYAQGDPVHIVDRSGLMGMMDIGASLNINAINASAAAVGIGGAALLYPHADNAVRTSLWHVMMYGRISHHVPQEAIEEMEKAEQKAKNKSHKPDERHHTVPKFLCGNDDQQRPVLSYQEHQVVHAGLAAVTISIEVSGEGVANTLSIPISRWRKPFILDLGRNELGRASIANAVGALYDIRGNNFGIPPETIGSVFPRERQRFVAGHRHPLCQ